MRHPTYPGHYLYSIEDLMPPKSKAQARFMRAVASGSVKKKGLSKAAAKEYVSGTPTKSLPERKSSGKAKRKRS